MKRVARIFAAQRTSPQPRFLATHSPPHALLKRLPRSSKTTIIFKEQFPTFHFHVLEIVRGSGKTVFGWRQGEVEDTGKFTFFDRIAKDIEIVRVCLLLTGAIQTTKPAVQEYLTVSKSTTGYGARRRKCGTKNS